METKGTISVNTENIFPIIKKFLYSDHEIFLRELVSNAVDATQKLQKLASIGEYNGEIGETKVVVTINEKAKTLTISDRGIGMTAEEIDKYINQIAFSGATEFVEKYEGTDTTQIIGKFGLGFYSAFMVADKVEINTLSHKDGAEAARWECEGSTSFEIGKAVKKERGTDVVLHINEDSKEFLEKFRIKSILEKYCKFLPVEIEFDGEKINNTDPIWTKSPNDLKDEDYVNFYKELYPYSENPMFWIHLNVDYPFNLTGILYFPKVKSDITAHKDKIQLYSRQVFITDEVKDVVPEFLMLLHGVIDSPDIPLNVSRSYLQSDSNVKKINTYITKKVADKLSELFKNDREGFEKKWSNVGLFVKYGMITDEKFNEKAKKFALLYNTEGKHFTLDEYGEHIQAAQTDKDGNKVILYTTDQKAQDAFINKAKDRGYDIAVFDGMLDSHFVGALERNMEKTTLKRVDSEVVDKLIEKDDANLESVLSEDDKKKVEELFKKVINDDKITVKIEALSPEEMPVSVTVPEFMRRMKEMAMSGGMMGDLDSMPDMTNVTVNANNELIGKISQEADETRQQDLAKQAYDLALLAQGMLTGGDLTRFIKRSVSMIG